MNYQYIRKSDTGANRKKARKIAEKALGRPLPFNAEIHHIDGNPANNNNSNLVVCEDTTYHRLLHTRTTAVIACGHANWKRCWICDKYSPHKDLLSHGAKIKGAARSYYHKKCRAIYERERRGRK